MKYMHKTGTFGRSIALLCCVGVTAGFAASTKQPDPQETMTPSSWMKPQGVYLFGDNFNGGSFLSWAKFTLNDVYAVELAPPRSEWGRQEQIKIVDAPLAKTPGNKAVQFTVPRSLNSFRAELALTQEPGYQERWYGLRVFIPADWVFDEADGGDIVTQWHHILGGAPAPQRGNYPPLSIAVKGNRWHINSNHGTVGRADRDNYLSDEQVKPGTWASWVVHAKWSPNSDGLLEIWLNGKQIVTQKGPNTYNTPKPHSPYWKIGIYHPEWKTRNAEKFNAHKAIIKKRTVVIDDTWMGTERASYKDVAPPQD